MAVFGFGEFEVSREATKLKLNVDFNPTYKGFNKDQDGLKEFIEKLLSGNEKAYKDVSQHVSFVDQIAESLVNRKSRE